MERMRTKITIAVLLTCFNRKDKTMDCLKSLATQQGADFVSYDIYLVDDGFDGTAEAVKKEYPQAQLDKGNGKLFWAGGMRLAWNMAIKSGIKYDYYLLLNDDTLLMDHAFRKLISDIDWLKNETCILVGTTQDPSNGKRTYGGSLLLNTFDAKAEKLFPNNSFPQRCHLGNANIMLVTSGVVNSIGILSDRYTHGIADFDYTLRAKRAGINTYISSSYLGYCKNDHGNNWMNSGKYPLKKRIEHLYSVKGLAYKEYLAYLKTHFPLYYPKAWFMLWMKTLFPILWDRFRKPLH